MTPRTPIKLYLDEHVWLGLAAALRERGHDVAHVYELGRGNLDDESQLAFAAAQGWAILTFNTCDFEPLATDWFFADKPHAGIIISNQLPIGELLRRAEQLLDNLSSEEMQNTIRYLHLYR